MKTIIQYSREYLVNLAKVWLIWVWFFLLDVLGLVIDTFVPDFTPSRQVYWLIAALGFIAANIKIFADHEKQISQYEYHAPAYEFRVVSVEATVCPNLYHVHVNCEISIQPTTPWMGRLVKITVDRTDPIPGLGKWQLSQISATDAMLSLPITIPDSGWSINIEFESEILEKIELSYRDRWRHAEIPVRFIVEYFTQPVGEVQKLIPLNVQACLEKPLQTILQYQSQRAE